LKVVCAPAKCVNDAGDIVDFSEWEDSLEAVLLRREPIVSLRLLFCFANDFVDAGRASLENGGKRGRKEVFIPFLSLFSCRTDSLLSRCRTLR
jgi:hypothetical protein